MMENIISHHHHLLLLLRIILFLFYHKKSSEMFCLFFRSFVLRMTFQRFLSSQQANICVWTVASRWTNTDGGKKQKKIRNEMIPSSFSFTKWYQTLDSLHSASGCRHNAKLCGICTRVRKREKESGVRFLSRFSVKLNTSFKNRFFDLSLLANY